MKRERLLGQRLIIIGHGTQPHQQNKSGKLAVAVRKELRFMEVF